MLYHLGERQNVNTLPPQRLVMDMMLCTWLPEHRRKPEQLLRKCGERAMITVGYKTQTVSEPPESLVQRVETPACLKSFAFSQGVQLQYHYKSRSQNPYQIWCFSPSSLVALYLDSLHSSLHSKVRSHSANVCLLLRSGIQGMGFSLCQHILGCFKGQARLKCDHNILCDITSYHIILHHVGYIIFDDTNQNSAPCPVNLGVQELPVFGAHQRSRLVQFLPGLCVEQKSQSLFCRWL